MSTPRSRFDLTPAIRKIARAQVAHPWLFLGAGLVVTAAAAVLVSQLRVDSSYEALLPEGSPDMRNINEVRQRTGGTRQFVVAISGGTPETQLSFARRLVPRLERIERVHRVDFEMPVDFFRSRALWLVDDETMEELLPALERAVKLVRERGDPTGLGLAWGRVQAALEDSRAPGMSADGIPRSRDGRYTFVSVVPAINFLVVEQNASLIREIAGVVDGLHPEADGLHVDYAGNLRLMTDQQRQMLRDMARATIVSVVLGVLIIVLFTRGWLGPVVISSALAGGVVWTFALAYLIVGHLNVITGFLVSTLIGLGINYGIHIFVRYSHDASQPGRDPMEALVEGVSNLFQPALTAALTTFGAFISFVVSDFRGFSEFGLLAAIGIMLTLASAYLFVPPLLVVTRRLHKLRRQVPSTFLGMRRLPYAPSVVVVVVFGVVATYGAIHIRDIPFHNDFQRLRGHLESSDFLEYVRVNTTGGLNPSVVLVDSVDEARRAEALVARRAEELAAGDGLIGIRRTLSIADLLPRDPERRRAQLERIREILSDPAVDDLVTHHPERAEQFAQVRRMLESEPWTVDEIPEAIRRRLVTPDGRQYLVLFWPAVENDADERMVAWDGMLRDLKRRLHASGIDALVADETVVAAWIHRLVVHDGPILFVVASIVVFLFVLLDLKSFWHSLLVSLGLGAGMLTFVACMHLLGWEINLFNLVVIPSLIGIGIDNAVYIYARYRSEGPGSLGFVVRRTGLECFLCSYTNAVGFGSVLVADHLGLRSMGLLAILGITNTFLSAVVFFPCLLTLLEGRRRGSKGGERELEASTGP
jgi:uncharacterized protein